MFGGRRRQVLGVLLGAVALLTALLLREVLATVFFAITVAYILYPLREWLFGHGVERRAAAGVCTAMAFVVGAGLGAPLVGALYLRRQQLFAFLRQLPETFLISVGELRYTLDIAGALATLRQASGEVAVALARATPVIALKLFVFTLVVYALLVQPRGVREALMGPIPAGYRDVVLAFHERTRSILYAIYVLQAAVAFGTFLIGFVVFLALGYESAFTLAVLAGILQFIPILGPSVIIVGLGAVELLAGNVADAVVVTVVGLIVVGFLPDALIRPRLARLTTGMPGSLYFVGFTGGVLSVGLVGLVAGPVVVALLAEAVSLISEESVGTQQRLPD